MPEQITAISVGLSGVHAEGWSCLQVDAETPGPCRAAGHSLQPCLQCNSSHPRVLHVHITDPSIPPPRRVAAASLVHLSSPHAWSLCSCWHQHGWHGQFPPLQGLAAMGPLASQPELSGGRRACSGQRGPGPCQDPGPGSCSSCSSRFATCSGTWTSSRFSMPGSGSSPISTWRAGGGAGASGEPWPTVGALPGPAAPHTPE